VRYLLVIVITVYTLSASASERPSYFDGSINGLHLLDTESGKVHLDDLPPNCQVRFFPAYCYVNEESTQKITLWVHPGSFEYSVAEVFIERASRADQRDKFPSDIQIFQSSKGVRLGISKSELIDRLGEPHQESEKLIQYRAEFEKYFLDTYNMPIYYGKYTFENGELVSFRYGFEYP